MWPKRTYRLTCNRYASRETSSVHLSCAWIARILASTCCHANRATESSASSAHTLVAKWRSVWKATSVPTRKSPAKESLTRISSLKGSSTVSNLSVRTAVAIAIFSFSLCSSTSWRESARTRLSSPLWLSFNLSKKWKSLRHSFWWAKERTKPYAKR